MKEEKRGHLAQQLVQLRRHLVHVARVAEQRRCLLLRLSSAMHGYAQVLQQRLTCAGGDQLASCSFCLSVSATFSPLPTGHVHVRDARRRLDSVGFSGAAAGAEACASSST